ncbi:MAG: S-adenosylmethionine decarboxylase [Gemmatimonadaceae bacterium]
MNGREWVVEAFGCSAERLCDLRTMQKLFDAMISELALHPVGEAQWHAFPAPGGITGVCILAESHLTVHTFPEHESLCLNLFCCTERAEWNFGEKLREHVGAERVNVRVLEREYVSPAVSVHAK